MQSKLTTKDVVDAVKLLDLIPLGLVRRLHLHHQDKVAFLTDADCGRPCFVGCNRPILCRVLIVDESIEVWVYRHGGCSDN